MNDQFYGVRESQIDERDYRLGGEMTLPEPESKYSDNQIQYNQDAVAGNSCTVSGALGALSDQTGYVFTLEERKYLWEKAKERGASDDWGWYVNTAVKLVADYWNGQLGLKTDCTNPVTYFRTSINTDEAISILDKGYSIVTGYRGNANYNKDAFFQGDCKLDMTENVGNTTYGHCVRIYKDNDLYVIDNYKDVRACNIYSLSDIKELVKNRVFFEEGYYFVTKNAIEKEKEKALISDWAVDAVQWCQKEGIASKWENPKEVVANNIAEKMLVRSKLLTVDTGLGVTKERMAVILYRLFLLHNNL